MRGMGGNTEHGARTRSGTPPAASVSKGGSAKQGHLHRVCGLWLAGVKLSPWRFKNREQPPCISKRSRRGGGASKRLAGGGHVHVIIQPAKLHMGQANFTFPLNPELLIPEP